MDYIITVSMVLICFPCTRAFAQVTPSIAVLTTAKEQTDLLVMKVSPKDLMNRLNSRHLAGKIESDELAKASTQSHDWAAMDFDIRRDEYFILDKKSRKLIVIQAVLGNFNKTVVLFERVSNKTSALAYDWLRRMLYWADPSFRAIFRLDVNRLCEGPSCLASSSRFNRRLHRHSRRHSDGVIQSVIGSSLTNPCSLAIDPVRGRLYWADDGAVTNLETSDLTGNARTLLAHGLVRPAGLTIDYSNQTLYWLERWADDTMINYCELGASLLCKVTRVSTEYQSQLNDLDYYQGFLISTDPSNSRVVLYDQRSENRLRQNWPGRANAVSIVAMERQPWAEVDTPSTPVRINPSDNLATPLSLHGAVLLADERTGIQVAPRTFFMGMAAPTPLRLLSRPYVTCMAADVRRKRLFFYDRMHKAIYRISVPDTVENLKYARPEKIVSAWTHRVNGLAVDWSTGNIYWVDSGYQRIMMARGDGSHPHVVHHVNISQPMDIVIDSRKRLMFWSETDSKGPRIERSDLNGKNRKIILDQRAFSGHPRALALDLDRDQLYWSDTQYICRSSLDGKGFESCERRDFTSQIAVKALAVMHDYILWTDFRGGVKAADKDVDFPLVGAKMPSSYEYTFFSDVIHYHESTQPLVSAQCLTASKVKEVNITSKTSNHPPPEIERLVEDPRAPGENPDQSLRCGHLCLPSQPQPTCACEIGYWPKPNGTCVPGITMDHFLVFCDTRSGRLFRQFALLPDYYAVEGSGPLRASDVTLDDIENKILWLDPYTQLVSSVAFQGGHQEVLFSGGKHLSVKRIKLLASHKLLYLVTKDGDVAVLGLESGLFTVIVQHSEVAIHNLAIDEEHKRLYMVGERRGPVPKPNDAKQVPIGVILTSILDGSDLQHLYTSLGLPTGISAAKGRIIWTDPKLQGIFMTKLPPYLPEEGQGRGNDFSRYKQRVIVVTLAQPEEGLGLDDVLEVDGEIFFTNINKRAVQRFRLETPNKITSVGYPYLNEPHGLNYYKKKIAAHVVSSDPSCTGISIPLPHNTSACLCDLTKGDTRDNQNIFAKQRRIEKKMQHYRRRRKRVTRQQAQKIKMSCMQSKDGLESAATKYALCFVPHVDHATITGTREGAYLVSGREIQVTCDPGYELSTSGLESEWRECRNGSWNSTAVCEKVLKYEIIGDSHRGHVIFRESMTFVVPHNVRRLDVVCIGGGGGGYDPCDRKFHSLKSAGDGGTSRFGRFVRAEGGKGGSMHEGGRGGIGRTLYGGHGNLTTRCLGGGAAGESTRSSFCKLSQTTCLFCGAGGAQTSCSLCPHRKGGCSGPGSVKGSTTEAADNYGGGGTGIFGSGSGGGGGYSRKWVRVHPQQKIDVVIGAAGKPSVRPAGDGVVVVGWGDRLESFVQSETDTQKEPCKPFKFVISDRENGNSFKKCFDSL